MNEYVEDYVSPPPLSDEEEAELWLRYTSTRDEEARSRLIENYLPLVVDIAERMSKRFPAFLEVQDLISYGSFGLLDAVRSFDPSKGVKFSTFCNLRIGGSIMDELRRIDWPSRQIRQKVNMVKRTREELENKLGRVAYDYEIAEHLGLDDEGYRDLMRDVQVKNMVSLDHKRDDSEDNETSHIENLADSKALDPLNELARRELKEVAMKGLSEHQKQVLILYYYENLNLKQIGEVLELSESRVCQIHQQTITFLKQKFSERGITRQALRR